MILRLLGIVLTVLVYWGCKQLYRRLPVVVFTPIVTSLLILVVILVTTHYSYTSYMDSAHWLTDLLGPSIVAMAVPLHKNYALLKQNAVAILVGIGTGSTVAIVSSVLLARLFHLSRTTGLSLAPRSVTTPIAMEISNWLGGIPTLTGVFVILTALAGIIVGPLAIKYLRIQSAVAKGTLYGTAAHGIGTSKAFEMGQLEGTYASLSMIIAAGLSVALALLLVPMLW